MTNVDMFLTTYGSNTIATTHVETVSLLIRGDKNGTGKNISF